MRSKLAIALVLFGAIAPLREDQRVRLETAFDGRDHQEEAFAALLENVAQWTEGVGDAPVRLHPDYDALLSSPDEYRGELFRIVGEIQQRTPLAAPFAEASEWFLRDDDGRPILLFVFSGDSPALPQTPAFHDGQEVMIVARFYKRVDAVARDGEMRNYPAFVGRFPVPVSSGGDTAGSAALLVLPLALIAGLIALFIVLLLVTRRQQKRPHRSPVLDSVDSELLDEAGELPDDPAEALDALKRRSEPEQ